MCFWGCFLYKKLGKNDAKGLAMDVSGGAFLACVLNFYIHIELSHPNFFPCEKWTM